MAPDYRYYAVTGLVRATEENPYTVLRVWEDERGHTIAEAYMTSLRWERTDELRLIERGSVPRDLVPTTLENIERFKVRMAERVREMTEEEQQG